MSTGAESPELYCNIGDSYFKQGNYPKAILFYERALKLDPSYSDARYNLEFAGSFVQDNLPGPFDPCRIPCRTKRGRDRVMFFEYPKLLWLLLVPFLLVLRYIYIEIKDRRPHLRVSKATPWQAGGKSVLGIIRHVPFILRIAALSLIVVSIARPRSSSKVERVDTEGIDIVLAMDVSTSMLARDFTPDRIRRGSEDLSQALRSRRCPCSPQRSGCR